MTQEFEGIESAVFKIEDREDNTIPVYKLEFWKLCLLISFHIIFAMMANTGQVMIIWYIRWYAPKQRPINRMILVDMVCSRSCNGMKQKSTGMPICFRPLPLFSNFE